MYIAHRTEIVLYRPGKHCKQSAEASLNSQKTAGKILDQPVIQHWYGAALLEDTGRSQ